jgi:hypothetical protein
VSWPAWARRSGTPDEAVAYLVTALAIRLKIGKSAAGHAQALAGLRRGLGDDRFRAALLARLDDESADRLMQMLDQQEETTGADPAATGRTAPPPVRRATYAGH